MTVALVERLLEAGADVVTAGNHAFDGDEAEAVLALDRVLRPHNVVDGAAGRGVITVAAGDEEVRVVVLADWFAMDGHIAAEPYPAWAALPPGPTTIVEIHALSVMAKQSLAYALLYPDVLSSTRFPIPGSSTGPGDTTPRGRPTSAGAGCCSPGARRRPGATSSRAPPRRAPTTSRAVARCGIDRTRRDLI
jgi:hypothetical protein